MKHFKTPKGTDLPLMDIRGKDYLKVAHRLVWMREQHPTWSIVTDYLELAENHAIARATIRDGMNIIATGHKYEDRKGFPDFIEKSETGAIGRALAACGFGTQFAPELEEGDRLADAPTQTKSAAPAPTQMKLGGAVRAAASVNHASEKQINFIKSLYPKKGWGNDRLKKYLADSNISNLEDMNSGQASHLIAVLNSLSSI